MSALGANYARAELGALQEALRADLSLNDNQLALLQGPALAIPVVIAMVPLGLLISRRSRTRLLLWTAVLNLIGSLLSATASNLSYLLLARGLVGLSATATFITILSLVGDLYPPHQRGRAYMVISVCQIAGMSIALALGGALLGIIPPRLHAWHWAIAGMSAPLLLPALLALALREPNRYGDLPQPDSQTDGIAALWQGRRVIAPLLIGVLALETALGAVMTWTVSVLSREFHLPPTRGGSLLGMLFLVSGLAGPVIGGTLADYTQRSGGPRRTLAMLGSIAIFAMAPALFPMTADIRWALTVLVLFMTAITAACVMGGTLFTIAIPAAARGISISLMTATSILFGVGVAPIAVSFVSTELGGPTAIGTALAYVSATATAVGGAAFTHARHNVFTTCDC